MGSDAPQYTVSVVADRLGVPIATLRSWNQRYGVGPAGHSPGRHRLYSQADIDAVTQMHQLIGQGASPRSAARVALSSVVPTRADFDSLLAAAFDLNLASVARQLEHHLRHYGVVETWDELIRPAFAAIVEKQEAGEGCIDVEHALSWTVSQSLQRLTPTAPTSASSVILACCAAETHTLALEALRAALTQRGRGVLMLGADVPASALTDAIRRAGPVSVVLWSQSADTADAAQAKAVIAAGGTVVLAGPGWQSIRIPKAARTSTFDEAVELLAP